MEVMKNQSRLSRIMKNNRNVTHGTFLKEKYHIVCIRCVCHLKIQFSIRIQLFSLEKQQLYSTNISKSLQLIFSPRTFLSHPSTISSQVIKPPLCFFFFLISDLFYVRYTWLVRMPRQQILMICFEEVYHIIITLKSLLSTHSTWTEKSFLFVRESGGSASQPPVFFLFREIPIC